LAGRPIETKILEKLLLASYLEKFAGFDPRVTSDKASLESLLVCSDLGSPDVSYDPVLRRYAHSWIHDATIDATQAALETLETLGDGMFIADHREDILSYLNSCFKSDEGIFWNGPHKATTGVYAIRCAIKIMKSLEGELASRPLGADRYSEFVRAFEGGTRLNPVDCVIAFLKRCAHESPYKGGMVDSPRFPNPSLTTLYMAIAILWDLGMPNDYIYTERIVPSRDALIRFFKASLKEYRTEVFDIAGFSLNPEYDEPCLCPTYFALKALCDMRIADLDEVVDRKMKKKIRRFVYATWRNGGFSATIGESPTLNATLFALKILNDLLPTRQSTRFLRKKAQDISRFTYRCLSESGGFAFSESMNENVLGTRFAIQILKWLESRKYLDHPLPYEIMRNAEVFISKLYDTDIGGFRGFPGDKLFPAVVELEKLWNQLNGQWEEFVRQVLNRYRNTIDDMRTIKEKLMTYETKLDEGRMLETYEIRDILNLQDLIYNLYESEHILIKTYANSLLKRSIEILRKHFRNRLRESGVELSYENDDAILYYILEFGLLKELPDDAEECVAFTRFADYGADPFRVPLDKALTAILRKQADV
jgi:prenyltransferase beta subunit